MALYEALTIGLGLVQGGMTLAGYASANENYRENMEAVLAVGQENAERAQREGQINLYKAEFEQRALAGMNKASLAAAGGSLTGSALDNIMAQDAINDFNNQMILYNAGIASRNALIDAKNQIAGLVSNKVNNNIATTGDLFNTALSTYSSIYNSRKQDRQNAQVIQNAEKTLEAVKEQNATLNQVFINAK